MKHIMIGFIIVLLFLAACKSEQNEEVQEGAAETPKAGEEQAETEEEEPSESALDEIKDLFSLQNNLEYRVSYTVSSESQGETMTNDMTYYMKNEKMRIDMLAEGSEVRTYVDETTFATCMKEQDWMCFEMQNEEQESWDAGDFREEFEANEMDYDVSVLAPRTIAGTLAACFKVTAPDASTEYCMSKKGVPLYVRVDAEEGGVTMMATEYETTVPDSAFDLPAEPEDMAALMGGFDPSMY